MGRYGVSFDQRTRHFGVLQSLGSDPIRLTRFTFVY